MNNRIGNLLGQATVVVIFAIVAIFMLKHFATTPYTTYYESNDGYVPVTFSPCEVVRERETESERDITVAYNGNEYACYVDRESEIRKGDVVWAGFAICEGNVELVDIK